MKITIQSYKNTYTWENEDDDTNIQQIAYQVKGLLVAAGFHPNNVDDIFVADEYEWFPEKNNLKE